MIFNLKGNVSKTKVGAILMGVAAVLATAGAWFAGTMTLNEAVAALIGEIGAVITALGIRDWKLFN